MKRKLLYVDDEQESLSLFKAALRDSYKIYLAKSVKEAKEILKNEKIPVIVSDQYMTEVTGIDFFKQLVEENSPAIRVLLTGSKDSDIAINAINEGKIYRYVKKPYQIEEIIQIIEEAFAYFDLETRKSKIAKNIIQEHEDKNKEIVDSIEDSILQKLSAASFFIASEDKKSQKGLDILNEGMNDIKNLSKNITPFTLRKFGLAASIENLFLGVVPFKISPNFPTLSEALEMHLFRLTEYFFNNHKVETFSLKENNDHTITIEVVTNDNAKIAHKVEDKIKLYKGVLKIKKLEEGLAYEIGYKLAATT